MNKIQYHFLKKSLFECLNVFDSEVYFENKAFNMKISCINSEVYIKKLLILYKIF